MRVDHVEAVYEVGQRLAAEDSELRIGLITASYAEDCREWSEPVRFKIVPDERHPGLEVVYFERISGFVE